MNITEYKNFKVKKKLIIVFHDNFRLFYKKHSHNWQVYRDKTINKKSHTFCDPF